MWRIAIHIVCLCAYIMFRCISGFSELQVFSSAVPIPDVKLVYESRNHWQKTLAMLKCSSGD